MRTLKSSILCLTVLSFSFSIYGRSECKLFPIKQDGKWGYMNANGQVIIKPRFAVPSEFSEGFADVRDDDGWFYYIDETGKVLPTDTKFRFSEPFSEGLAAVQGELSDDKIGFIDRTGRMVIEPLFDRFSGKPVGSFHDGIAMVRLNGGVGFINRTGEFIILPRFDDASPFTEGLAMVILYRKAGFIDSSGKFIIVPRYEMASGFSDGLASVMSDGRWGFVDKTGRFVIEPKYDLAFGFREGRAIVRTGAKWSRGGRLSGGKNTVIGKDGATLIAASFDGVNVFSEGLAPILIGGLWGLMDEEGNIVVAPQFRWIDPFECGLARVTTEQDAIGYIDRTGAYIRQPTK